MKLPALEQCKRDPFLYTLYQDDKKQFLSTRWGSNQKFGSHRRIFTAYELMKKWLVPAPAKFADFACGQANMGLLMANDGYTVDLVDNEPKFFEYIQLKSTGEKVNFIQADASKFIGTEKYHGIFFGEAIEHMAEPLQTLKNLRENLQTGGILCLTTPNGDFINCKEPAWKEVENQTERNMKLANTIGNHVCEFRMNELAELVKMAGFSLLEHQVVISEQISRSPLLRKLLPRPLLWKLDQKFSWLPAGKVGENKNWGMTQIIVAQRAR